MLKTSKTLLKQEFLLTLTPSTDTICQAFQSAFSFTMAKKSVIARSKKTPKFKSRVVRRCFRCGRAHGYMRAFDLCRICFREQANEGNLPGIKKASW